MKSLSTIWIIKQKIIHILFEQNVKSTERTKKNGKIWKGKPQNVVF